MHAPFETIFEMPLAPATGVDLREVQDLPALRAALQGSEHGADLDAPSYPALVDLLYKKTVRPHLIQPCFLVGHPVDGINGYAPATATEIVRRLVLNSAPSPTAPQ